MAFAAPGGGAGELEEVLARLPRRRLATLPTPLEAGPELPGGARLHVKRDDLTGLGLGGNKARKLEFLCGAALATGADTLLAVGAAQSNHARMTAAAGAILGLETHLVLGGPAGEPRGNQLVASMFGARIHHTGTEDWDEIEDVAEALGARLEAEGRRVYAMPIGGSTPTGALGYLLAWAELAAQCEAAGIEPVAVVLASSTGGTHGGLLAGRALWQARGRPAPLLIPVAVALGGARLAAAAVAIARDTLALAGIAGVEVDPATVEVDARWRGQGYGVPSRAGGEAAEWAARRGGWVLDQTYTAKAFAGLLAAAEEGRVGRGEDVVFWHTGGHPAVFA